MKDFSRGTQMTINLLSSLVVFATGILINFFLSPYIIENIGVEANGFLQLGNNFINYANLLITVVNSMAGRFITIEIHTGNKQKANIYYTSVYFANLLMLLIFLLPVIGMIFNLENIIDIPIALVSDIKLLYIFTFFNFLSGLAVPMWGSCTYITNKLYISSLGSLISSIIRVVTTVALFAFFEPKVWYVTFATFLVMIFTVLWGYNFKKKLTPELKINSKSFDFKAVTELMAAGVWNAISSLGITLLSGLDLLICNLFIGSFQMGVLSVAKIVPNQLSSLSSTICNVFAPELTINFAKGNKELLKNDLKQAMNITGIILTIPLAILFVFGDSFFRLWVPSQNAEQLQILSALTVLGYIFTSGTQVLYNVFVTVNKVKTNSILMLLSGVISTAVVFVCLKLTNWGVFAVAGVSSVVNLIRNMGFTVPFTAKYLGFKWNTFYPQVAKSILSVIILVTIGYLLKIVIYPTNWLMLFLVCGFTAVIGFGVNIYIVLSKNEREIVCKKIFSKFKNGENE